MNPFNKISITLAWVSSSADLMFSNVTDPLVSAESYSRVAGWTGISIDPSAMAHA